MLISATVRALLALGLIPAPSLAGCEARDFLAIDMAAYASRPAIEAALELGYPGLQVNLSQNKVAFPDGTVLPIGAIRDISYQERLARATIAEQFAQEYPLEFDLEPRKTAWHDPGRARNAAFFETLYFDAEYDAARSIKRVEYRSPQQTARFAVTERHCVATQLQAALQLISTQDADIDRFFRSVGGSFNWRTIAGTKRLSTHSFGIAIDLNPALGGYWRWAGREDGAVGVYANQVPKELVQIMERFGFIWGGKWHHFDGMHFEYRPELIVFSRLTDQN
jgi:hypothetical protein